MTDLTPPADRAWYARHGCTHAHCPAGCEHPQPAVSDGTHGTAGEMYCMACWFSHGTLTAVVPCGPGVCD